MSLLIYLPQVKMREIVSFAISGSIDYLEFIQCDIGKIYAYAINCIYYTVYNISFVHTQIDQIESQAVKKMKIENFVLRNTTIKSPLPTRAFYDLIIENTFTISDCSFSTISTEAISIRGIE